MTDEEKAYVKNCEDLIKARTEQLRVALTRVEELEKLLEKETTAKQR